MNELDFLLEQLDLLIGFLDVSDADVYEIIKNHDRFNIGLSIDDLYGKNYENYRNHVTTSALILGFTHFEDFLTKMTEKLLFKFQKYNKIKVTIEKFEDLGADYRQALGKEQAENLKFPEKIALIKNIFENINKDLIDDILYVNKVRNCLMHNNGHADQRLTPKYSNGEKIILSSGEVNEFGLKAREFSRELWNNIMGS